MSLWFANPVRWSWLLQWLYIWEISWASTRLDSCTVPNGCADAGSGSGSGSATIPCIQYFQTSTRNPDRPVRMNYAWSTIGFPTLFLSQSFDSRTCSNGSFSVLNESDYLTSQRYGSVEIAGSDSPTSFAIVFRRLIKFDAGKKYKAADGFDPSELIQDVNETKYQSVYLNQSVGWSYNDDKRQIVGSSGLFKHLGFTFQLPWTEEDRRISYFPKTKYTQNSTVFDITLCGFNYTKGTRIKNSRIALEMIMVNGERIDKSSTHMSSTEDDEYTPSVFRTWEYYFNERGTPNQAYLQWKPISYQSHMRRSTKSQGANIVFPNGRAIGFLDSMVPQSLASALFNNSTPLNGTALYIVVGNDGDETYINSSHLTWTAVVGFGRVPTDTISIEVIIIIIVALGIPAVLVFLGGFYVTYKKKPWQNVGRGFRRLRGIKGYERIN